MRMRIIDAFAERPFSGNPAAVCLLEGQEWPDERWIVTVLEGTLGAEPELAVA